MVMIRHSDPKRDSHLPNQVGERIIFITFVERRSLDENPLSTEIFGWWHQMAFILHATPN